MKNTVCDEHLFGFKCIVKRSLLEMHHFISFVDLTGDNVVSQLGGEWKDFEDAVQYGCAIGDFSGYIVTRNAKDFERSSIPVVSPKAMLERLGVDSIGERNGVDA